MNHNIEPLKKALDDEYKARATYMKVIEDFGNIRPFINILQSEQRHIDALKPFFEKYAIEIPNDPYQGKIESFSSVAEACKMGVQAEIENGELYEQIIEKADDPELIEVFHNLRDASQNRHLRAFQRCVAREGCESHN